MAKSASGSHRFSYNDNCYFISFPFFCEEKGKETEAKKRKTRDKNERVIRNYVSEPSFYCSLSSLRCVIIAALERFHERK